MLRVADTNSWALDSFPYFQSFYFPILFANVFNDTNLHSKNYRLYVKKQNCFKQKDLTLKSITQKAYSRARGCIFCAVFRAGQQHCALKCGIQRIFNWYRYTEVTREAVRRPVNHRCHLFRVPKRRYPPRQKWPPAHALTAVRVGFIFHILIVKGLLPIFSLVLN